MRRIEFTVDFNALEGGGIGTEMKNRQRVDYFDFDTDIAVEVPADWVEVTDQLKDFVTS